MTTCTHPDGVPVDIWNRAVALANAKGHGRDLQVMRLIADGMVDERERCAVLAEGRAKAYDFQKGLADMDDIRVGINTARIEIGDAIRAESIRTDAGETVEGQREFSFVLNCELPEDDRDVDDLVERLFEAGCGDSLVGSSVVGVLALDFTREATTFEHAVLSAMENVSRAIPRGKVALSPDML